MFCTRCGHQSSPDSRFCASCGAQLQPPRESSDRMSDATSTLSLSALQGVEGSEGDLPGQGPPAAEEHVDALPAGSALLVVKRGPSAGSRFLLEAATTTAGRHPESDIFLDDVTVSRRHAEFRREGGAFQVRDVGSLNGTYLNRERIDEADLSGADEVQIGKFRLVFLLAAGTPPPSAV